jgi:hypothetical protein
MSTEGISQVAYNIIGGFIIGGLTLIGHWFYRQLHACDLPPENCASCN